MTSRRRATEEPHHERNQPIRPLQLCRVSRRSLHLWLPPAGERGLRLCRDLLLRHGLRLRCHRLLRRGLQLRQELMTKLSRGAPRDAATHTEDP